MRIYQDCLEAINETTREIFSRGQKVFDETMQGKDVSKEEYEQKEILGYGYRLVSHDKLNEMLQFAREELEAKHVTKEYGEAWFQSMIKEHGKNPPECHKKYWPEYWKKFGIEKDGRYSYTYTQRLVNLSQLIDSFTVNKYRRGAVLTVYEDSKDANNWNKGRRIPCSLAYHFIIRKQKLEGVDKLQLIYTQRSSDFINFFALDVYRAIRLQQYVAKKLTQKMDKEIKPGVLHHFISSVHAYKVHTPKKRRW